MTKIYALEKGLVGKCSLGDARGRKNREKLREEEENPGKIVSDIFGEVSIDFTDAW